MHKSSLVAAFFAVLFGACGGGGSSANDGGPDSGTVGAPDGGDAGSPANDGGSDGGSLVGAPITGQPDGGWAWVPFANALCRDGSTTGIAINQNPGSTKLMIYLQAGGACFDTLSCSLGNPSSFGIDDYNALLDGGDNDQGIFDRQNPANPVADWSYVFIPYCTGDVHVGNAPNTILDGMTEQFVGYRNVGYYLQRIAPTFPGLTEILLTGDSAGGFGSAGNYAQVARYFPGVPMQLLDDSGPPMEDPYLAFCLQNEWRTLWGLDSTIIADCGSDCSDGGNFLLDYYRHEASTHPNQVFGLVESTADSIISDFFGFGADNCASALPTPLPPETFDAGLVDLRNALSDLPNTGLFAFASTDHTSIGGAVFYTRTTGVGDGGLLVNWTQELVDGGISNIGP